MSTSSYVPILLAVFCSLFRLPRAQAADFIVSAAASLTNAFREAGKLFEKSQPGHKAVFNFASSDVLLAQIAKGAPVGALADAFVKLLGSQAAQAIFARHGFSQP